MILVSEEEILTYREGMGIEESDFVSLACVPLTKINMNMVRHVSQPLGRRIRKSSEKASSCGKRLQKIRNTCKIPSCAETEEEVKGWPSEFRVIRMPIAADVTLITGLSSSGQSQEIGVILPFANKKVASERGTHLASPS